MFDIELDCGVSVDVEAFFSERTYAGVIMGRPDRQDTERMIEEAARRPVALWGKRKTHLIQPMLDMADPEHPMLPPLYLAALLFSWDFIGDVASDVQRKNLIIGSQLVVAWFGGPISRDESLHDFIKSGVRGIAWRDLAENCSL